MNRRNFLETSSMGFGWLSLASMMQAQASTHFPAKAKRVIFLCMQGAPSHVDTFDYKPKLKADHGKAGKLEGSKLMSSRWDFKQYGSGGLWISSLFPELAKSANDLCFLHGMQTEIPAHPQAYLKLHTGTSQFVRPSLGAWTHYGLGSLNENLPGFISLTPPSGFGGAQNYGSAFLPAIHQGTRIGSEKRPIAGSSIPNLTARGSAVSQRAELDFLQSLNRAHLQEKQSDPQIEGVIQSYELAYKMQSEMPEVMDISKESIATQEQYGIGNPITDDFGRKCLLARRLVEAGVRFVEINHGEWDHHFNIGTSLPSSCASVDKPMRGLLEDLKQRGLLHDTLVIWSGEFGRTPHSEGSDGRDHNVKAFTSWMAGGGVKGGFAHGSSDDYGYEAVSGKVAIHDWHSTILHLLGLDHEKLTYRYAGRDFRLTDVHGNVVKEIIA